MIAAGYVRHMARYNAWQNGQLIPVLEMMSPEELGQNRGAFFGSLLGTANHLLWGDTLWMSRFNPSIEPPSVAASENTSLHGTIQSWVLDRRRIDAHITEWAGAIRDADLAGDLTWYSGLSKCDMQANTAVAVTHFFNHQTHHRGQIHAMLTAAGQKAPVTDLVFMPEDA